MDRREALRIISLGFVGLSGCGNNSTGSRTVYSTNETKTTGSLTTRETTQMNSPTSMSTESETVTQTESEEEFDDAIQWQYELGVDVYEGRGPVARGAGVPALGDELLYVSCSRGICAVATDTGNERWSYDESPWGVLPRDETVYLVDSTLIALDATDGSVRWRFETNAASGREWAVVSDDTISLVTETGQVFGIDTTDGSEQWRWEADTGVVAAPAVRGDTVYLATPTDIRALAATDGSERWRFEPAQSPRAVFVIGDAVYLEASEASAVNTLYALDASDGTERWQFQTGSEFPPTVTADTVYAWGRENRLHALEPDDGTVRWQHVQSHQHTFSPAGDNETVYIATTDTLGPVTHREVNSGGTITALTTSDGASQWSYEDWVDFITWMDAQAGTVYLRGRENLYAVTSHES